MPLDPDLSERLSDEEAQRLGHQLASMRLLEPISYIPPAEAEANYYRQLASQTTGVAT